MFPPTDGHDHGWQAFIDGPLYDAATAPWRDDPAFAVLVEHPGLRNSVGGHVAAVLRLIVHMVQVVAQVDLLALAHSQHPAHGLCVGFGMNALEPYDLLHVFRLDQVHAYEWIGEHLIEAAQTLYALQDAHADLAHRVRLHHGTLSDLRALPDYSVRVVYAANIFHYEIPMTTATFSRGIQEILRVLADGGMIISRGSIGAFETALAPYGCLLLQTPLGVVFHKGARPRNARE